MINSLSPANALYVPPATLLFDSQLSEQRAIAANSNEEAFLREIASQNALDTILNAQTSPANDQQFIGSSTFLFLNEVTNDFTSSDSIKAQQLHDIGILQRDMVLLQEASDENAHIPLSDLATTVDLSSNAQELSDSTNGNFLTSPQLEQITSIIEPIANEPLTPDLIEQIQSELDAKNNPIQLSMSTMNLALNLIAAQQVNPTHLVDNSAAKSDETKVVPVVSIGQTRVG